METNKISNNMLERMPLYLNYVKSLPKDVKNISATKIANALGFGEVLVRKDLAKVSDGGRCKLGYLRNDLICDIEEFLDIKNNIDAIIVGKGDMLQAMLGYEGFEEAGLNIAAGFDTNCSKKYGYGDKIVYPIKKLDTFLAEQQISMAILMDSGIDMQELCDHLVSLEVNAIWNFTSTYLNVPEHVIVQNESITTSVAKIRMQLKEKSKVI